MRQYRMYIDGGWCDAVAGETMEAVNPSTSEVFGTIAHGRREDAYRAIQAAQEAAKIWSKTPLRERSDLCVRISEVIAQHADELGDLLTTEVGKPRHSEATLESSVFTPAFYHQAAEQARMEGQDAFLLRNPTKRLTHFRRPWGVVAAITPWVFPAMFPSEILPYAVVTGNTVVWAAAPQASATAATLMRYFHEAGLPKGVVNLVTGLREEVGDEFVTSPGTDAVAMGGSSENGRIVRAQSGLKPCLMELGGNGVSLVLPDADPVAAARAIASACFFAAGQVSSSAERILVANSLKHEFVEALVAETEQWMPGDVWNANTKMGPLRDADVVKELTEQLDDALQRGATLVKGGRPVEGPGHFFEPTVLLDFDLDSRINKRETFGPLASVRGFGNDEEAWQAVNSTEPGLFSAVFSEDTDVAHTWAESIRSGIVVINDQTNYWELHDPFGGMRDTTSGVSRLGGRHMLDFMTAIQTIAVEVE